MRGEGRRKGTRDEMKVAGNKDWKEMEKGRCEKKTNRFDNMKCESLGEIKEKGLR